MNTTLLSAGIVCVIAAIVGGGLKAFNIEIPALNSLRRQLMLGLLGLVLLVIAWRYPSTNGSASTGRVLTVRLWDIELDTKHAVIASNRFTFQAEVKTTEMAEVGEWILGQIGQKYNLNAQAVNVQCECRLT
jgi:hypothetical protein